MRYGLIGEKLGHSFSREIHERIGKYSYELIELDVHQFDEFMTKKEFSAINVTIPYKEKVIPYLDWISEEANKIGAVNTIVNKGGKLYGYNTDYMGLKEMISYFDIAIKDKKVMILGTGGTSKTASLLVSNMGAKDIVFVSSSGKHDSISYEDITYYKKDIEVVINTTPKEMYPHNYEHIVSLENFDKLESVIDVIYNPLRTNLVLDAMNRNLKTCSGLFMLVAQAIYAIELFNDLKLDKQVIVDVYKDLLFKKENIVLIGMPSCGKTTIGRNLSRSLKKKFYDSDKEIVKRIQMPIAEFFKTHSEEEFREIETDVIKSICTRNSLIIATGGGSVLRQENINNLKQNGRLIFLNRPLELLKTTKSRPLSSNKKDLEKRYQERYKLYVAAADKIIDASKPIDDIVEEILGGK